MNIILIVLILIIIFYIYCYFIFSNNIIILQTNLNDFDFSLLLERQPLVIEDYIIDILSVIKSWFSSNIVQDANYNEKYDWNQNNHKFMFVYALEDTEILLYPPNKKIINDTPDNDEPIIGIQLKTSQSLIIPFKWSYNIKNTNSIKLYGIHDYITYLLFNFSNYSLLRF